MRAAISAGAWLALTLVATGAAAQDPMAAEVLFDQAVADMEAGRFAEACPKIAESQRLEPRSGTLFTLAECWAHSQKPATAVARYREYLRVFSRMSDSEKASQRGRDRIASQKIAELEPVVPKLRVTLKHPIPPGTKVTRNGIELSQPSLNAWLPLDPGEHVLIARAPGGPLTTLRVQLSPGEGRSVELEVKPAPRPPAPKPGAAAPATPKPSPDVPVRAADGFSAYRIGAIAAGGVALVGLVVGSTTGVMVLDRKGQLQDQCGIGGDPAACTQQGKSDADSAQALATVSTVSFVLAGVAGALSVGLLVVEPAPGRRHASWSGGARPVLGWAGRW